MSFESVPYHHEFLMYRLCHTCVHFIVDNTNCNTSIALISLNIQAQGCKKQDH